MYVCMRYTAIPTKTILKKDDRRSFVDEKRLVENQVGGNLFEALYH